jgi:hypothetical protein
MASPREMADRCSARARDTRALPASVNVWSNARPIDHRVPTYAIDVRPAPPAPRRHHFHDVPPGPHYQHHDYVFVDRGGWWPRWYPYWDPQWYVYWWYLYDHYGGDAYPEYAEYARDAVLRQYAPQWGLNVSGAAPSAQVGIQPYGVSRAVERYSPQGYARPDQVAAYRALALEQARRIQAAVNRVLVGFRDSPWGSELTIFGTRAGLQRWANEQAADADVWYAAAFDLGASSTPLSEVAR